jgi:hypothetical protein
MLSNGVLLERQIIYHPHKNKSSSGENQRRQHDQLGRADHLGETGGKYLIIRSLINSPYNPPHNKIILDEAEERRNKSSQPGGSSRWEGAQNTPYKPYGGA